MIKTLITNMKELKKPCVEVPNKKADVSFIIQDLKDTLTYLKHGYALAANQIGYTSKIFVARFPTKDGKETTEMVFINPRIVEKEQKLVHQQEGCLSFQGIRVDTDRHMYVTLAYFDEQFVEKTVLAQGLESMIIQHEVDHLEGRTIFDRKHKAK